MHKSFLITAAVLGALAVALGAFAAHGLKKIVPPETVATFETGVRYMFYHCFALFVTGILYQQFPHKLLIAAARFFMLGILFFSGSLFLLTAFKATDTVGINGIGLITPIGGLFFIVGWLLLAIGILKK